MILSGDIVYYKRVYDRQWYGPGEVIGVDGQQILVKHGSNSNDEIQNLPSDPGNSYSADSAAER